MENISKIKYLGRRRPKFSEISQLKSSWQIEIGTHMNVIPRNTNLSCYKTVDKSIIKNIEHGVINYVPLLSDSINYPKVPEKSLDKS